MKKLFLSTAIILSVASITVSAQSKVNSVKSTTISDKKDTGTGDFDKKDTGTGDFADKKDTGTGDFSDKKDTGTGDLI